MEGDNGQGMADWCRAKVQYFLPNRDPNFELRELKDGRVGDWKNRGSQEDMDHDEKYKFEDDNGDRQNCKWNTDLAGAQPNRSNGRLYPTLAWSKMMNTGDDEQDNALNATQNLTLYWKFNDPQGEHRGHFDGFYIDDPQNSIFAGAQAIAAGVVSTAALVYATI